MASNDYEVLELIGRGSFGQIRKVRRKSDGLILVRKEISYHRMTTKEKEQLTAEFGILAQLRHPNIVQYCHREHIKADSTLYLYMEYCGNGDLSQIIRKCRDKATLVPESMVWSIFTQIVLALYRCHNGIDPPELGDGWTNGNTKPHLPPGAKPVRILHRDLKPENIFLGQDHDVKLGDFGLSKMLGPEQHLTTTYVGTPYYMSPEIVSDQPYTHKSDIWSLGCIIYELCTLSPPFNAKTQWSLIEKIKQGHYAPIPVQYSDELRRMIDLCLQVDHRQRPDTAELLDKEQFRLARRERELVQMNRLLKLREEQLKQHEQALLMKDEEMRKMWEERSIKLHEEIDADLRAKWEIKAEMEIRRRVEMELQSRFQAELQRQVEYEVQRRIQELDLVPRSSRAGSPLANSGSSGASSGMFNRQTSPPPRMSTPHLYRSTAPDSPADITMASPSVNASPARSIFTNEPLNEMLPPELTGPAKPDTPSKSLHESRLHDSDLDDSQLEDSFISQMEASPGIPSFGNPTKPKYLSTAAGSPRKSAIPPRRTGPFKRSGTDGMLIEKETNRENYGLGGAGGESLDDVAMVKPDNSKMNRGMSRREIFRMQKTRTGESAMDTDGQQSSTTSAWGGQTLVNPPPQPQRHQSFQQPQAKKTVLGTPAKWKKDDPDSLPSPFKKPTDRFARGFRVRNMGR